jgi:hypothetical protein
MVEVLVASTILIVIVMMLGMLFQQTSLSWRLGVKRADGFTQVRAVIGAIQRDAAGAVDARGIPDQLKSKLGGGDQVFRGGSLKFYTLTGQTTFDKAGTPVVMRALKYVTYETSGNRTEVTLTPDGKEITPPSNVLPSSGRLGNTSSTSIDNFEAEYGQGGDLDPQGLPLYITFDANVSASGANLEIGAASAGPDRIWNTKDDIRTWVED